MIGAEGLTLLEAASQGDEEAYEAVLAQNSGLIWSIVRRYTGRGVDTDDLYQLACLGFLKAVRGFDPAYGTQFSTYAVPKIAGEIRRFLRDDGPLKVSRSLRERATAAYAVRDMLAGQLGREPTISEIAAHLGVGPEEIAAAETAAAAPASLQAEAGDNGLTLESLLGADGMEDQILERMTLKDAIYTLPEKEKSVILLRFYKGLTQDRAARVMGISQVQVSRLERRAISRLRQQFEKDL